MAKNNEWYFLQMGRLIESFSQVELINTTSILALKIFVMEDHTLENLGAIWVSSKHMTRKT